MRVKLRVTHFHEKEIIHELQEKNIEICEDATLVLYEEIAQDKILCKKENEKIKKMLDFPNAVTCVTIILLLSICVVNVLIPSSATTISRNNYAVIDTYDYSYLSYSSSFNLDDASFAKLFFKMITWKDIKEKKLEMEILSLLYLPALNIFLQKDGR